MIKKQIWKGEMIKTRESKTEKKPDDAIEEVRKENLTTYMTGKMAKK